MTFKSEKVRQKSEAENTYLWSMEEAITYLFAYSSSKEKGKPWYFKEPFYETLHYYKVTLIFTKLSPLVSFSFVSFFLVWLIWISFIFKIKLNDFLQELVFKSWNVLLKDIWQCPCPKPLSQSHHFLDCTCKET